jgi:hypothetical protein
MQLHRIYIEGDRRCLQWSIISKIECCRVGWHKDIPIDQRTSTDRQSTDHLSCQDAHVSFCVVMHLQRCCYMRKAYTELAECQTTYDLQCSNQKDALDKTWKRHATLEAAAREAAAFIATTCADHVRTVTTTQAQCNNKQLP